jgi:threonine dehydratase
MGSQVHRLPATGGAGTMTTRQTDAPVLVTLAAIRAAAERLRGITVRTPLVGFGPPADRRFLKAESLQPIGAFKLRGAYVAIASLRREALARGVITYSSGNHAQGVARAARLMGAPAVVVMPSDAPELKRERVAADGAEIVVVGTASDERQRVAEEIAARRGLAIIPPFDDDRIIAGQGTVGLEISRDLSEVATVVVCVGGGGLISGIATAVKALCPGARVVGVEPELAADAQASFREGRIVTWPAAEVTRTICDGVRTQALGELTFASIAALVDEIVTVSDEDVLEAMRWLALEAKLLVEPTAALTLAALRTGAVVADGPVVLVVSGGNVDPALAAAVLAGSLP